MHCLLLVRSSTPNTAIGRSSHPFRWATALTCLALLTSCASVQYDSPPVEVKEVPLLSEEQTDENGASAYDDDPALEISDLEEDAVRRQTSQAEYYQRQALNQSDADARVDATLSSAEYYVQAGDHQRAAELAMTIRDDIQSEQDRHRAMVILAYADYASGDHQMALLRLEPMLQSDIEPITEQNDEDRPLADNGLDTDQAQDADGDQTDGPPSGLTQRTYIDATKRLIKPETLSTQQVDALLLSSFCYQALGQHESAIAALIRRESALYGSAKAETTRYIWQVINAINLDNRQQLLQTSTLPQVRNRVQQSLEGQIGDQTSAPQQFNQWREDPTPNAATNSPLMDDAWKADSPRSVFVLLPFSSRFDKAAQAVKAGIEREHNLNTSSYRPTVNYYDIGDNPLQIGQYYAAAVRAGADFIIGPIGKTFSNEANNSSAYFVNASYANARPPMLMLGGDQPLNSGSLRLSISPELEGQRVAERAWQDGYLSAGILATNSVNDQRVLNGFTQRWLALGGKISKSIEYSQQQYDHSLELKQLFGVHLSENRHRKLSQTLGFSPEFFPYQRADIDFVFMLADNQSGRIVRPQINFFTNAKLPVYSTSYVYNGIKDTIKNMDLNGTRFPVMPWVVRSATVSPYAGQLNMLYAMGMDAYRIAGNIPTLRANTANAISGNTGLLQLAENGEVIHQPVWAEFSDGALNIRQDNALDLTPLGPIEDSNDPFKMDDGSNSTGSYNDQNWDSGESRRKTGG